MTLIGKQGKINKEIFLNKLFIQFKNNNKRTFADERKTCETSMSMDQEYLFIYIFINNRN